MTNHVQLRLGVCLTRNLVMKRWERIGDWVRNRGLSTIEWRRCKATKLASSHVVGKMDEECHLHPKMICKNWDHNSILLGEKPDLKLLSCHASQSWVALIASQSGVLIIVSNIQYYCNSPKNRCYTPHNSVENPGTSYKIRIRIFFGSEHKSSKLGRCCFFGRCQARTADGIPGLSHHLRDSLWATRRENRRVGESWGQLGHGGVSD